MPVASFRAIDRDQLELLTMRDLAKHYRRCTASYEGLERSGTKSTRASEALP